MTLTINPPARGYTGERGRIGLIDERFYTINAYLRDTKWGYVARWKDIILIQEPVYMTERKAKEDAIAEIEAMS